jgi:hypothetical protein
MFCSSANPCCGKVSCMKLVQRPQCGMLLLVWHCTIARNCRQVGGTGCRQLLHNFTVKPNVRWPRHGNASSKLAVGLFVHRGFAVMTADDLPGQSTAASRV